MGKIEQKVKGMDMKQREQLVKKIAQTACNLEKEYHACSRSTLLAFEKHLNLGSDEAYKASLAFSGGVAGNCEVCGALIGTLMAIGLAYGSEKSEFTVDTQDETLLEVKVRSNRVYDGFKEKFGSVRCSDVQKAIHGRSWNLRNPIEHEGFMKPEIHDRCGDVAGLAAQLGAEAILSSVDKQA